MTDSSERIRSELYTPPWYGKERRTGPLERRHKTDFPKPIPCQRRQNCVGRRHTDRPPKGFCYYQTSNL